MATELLANFFQTVQTGNGGPLSSSATSMNVANAAPSTLQGGQFRITWNDGTGEIALVTAGQSGTTWTISRGVSGTTAAMHQDGVTVRHILTVEALVALPASANASLASIRNNMSKLPRPGAAPSLLSLTSDQATLSQSTDIADAFGGSSKVLKLVASAGSEVDFYLTSTADMAPAAPGQTWTLSFYTYAVSAGATYAAELQWMTSGGSVISSVSGTNTSYAAGAWTRVSITATAPANTAYVRLLGIPTVGGGSGTTFYVDGILVEQSAALGTYFDGSGAYSGPTSAALWQGTAFNSVSSMVTVPTTQPTVLTRRARVVARAAGTNACVAPRPGLAPSLSAWTSDNGTVSQSASIADAFGGSNQVVKITQTSSEGQIDFYPNTTGSMPAASPGDVWSVSAYVYKPTGNTGDGPGDIIVQWVASDGTTILRTDTLTGVTYSKGAWQRIGYTPPAAPASTAYVRPLLLPINGGAANGDIGYIDGLLFEKTSSVNPYFDGSVTNGAWSGTAFASTSTYTPGDDSFLEGVDPMQAYVQWMIDLVGKGWFQGIDAGSQRITNVAAAVASTDALSIAALAPVSSLPSQIYALSGRELGIYWENFLRPGLLPIDELDFTVTCMKGEQDQYRWFYTPVDADAGTYTWSLAVYSAGLLLATFSTTLNVIASGAASGVTRKLVTIGDSTTDPGFATQVWLAELARLQSGDVMHVTQVGTRSATDQDSLGGNQTVHSDALSGKTISYFYSNASSPFVFSGSFNFAQYLSTNSFSMSSGDWVMIHLGINDVFGATSDSACQSDISTMLSQLASMITSIKSAVSGVRIGLLMTIPPVHSQDGFGYEYGSASALWRYRRNRHLWAEALRANYSDVTVSNVYALPLHLNLDCRNNYPTTTVAVNARNPATYTKQAQSVHPVPLGFWQMADSVWSYLKAFA